MKRTDDARLATPSISRDRLVHGFQLALLLVLVAASVVGLLPLQRAIGKRLDALKQQTVKQIERITNREISYDSISPSVLHFLEIRGLRIYDDDPAHTQLLSLRQVQVYYNIFTLFSGDPLRAISDIRVENSTISIDTQRDGDLIRFLREVASSPGGGSPQLPGLPPNLRLSGRNLAVTVHGPAGTFAVDRLFFQLRNTGSALDVQVRGGVGLSLTDRPAGLADLGTTVQISGQIAQNLQWSDLRVRFEKLSSNLVTVVRPTFQLSLRDGLWQLRKIQDKAPLDLQVSYDQLRQVLRFSFVADRLRPDYYFKLGPTLAGLDPWLTSVVSGSGSLSYSIPTTSLSYAVDASVGVNNRLLPAPLSLSVRLTGDQTSANVSLLQFESAFGSGQFAGTVDLKTLLPTGSLSLLGVDTPLGGKLSGSVDLTSAGKTVRATSALVSVGSTQLADLAVSATLGTTGANFDGAASFASGPRDNRVTVSGNVQFKPSTYVQASIETKSLPLSQLYAFITPNPSRAIGRYLDGLALTSQVFIASDLRRYSFASPQATIASVNEPTRTLTMSVSGSDKSLNVRSFDLAWDVYRGSGSLTANFTAPGRIDFATRLRVQGIAYEASGFYVEGDSLVVNGNYGLNVAAIRQGQRYLFHVTTSDLPVPLRAYESKLSLDLEGYFADAQSWEVLSRRSSVTNLPFVPLKDNRVTLSARISSRGGEIYSISYGDTISRVSGNGRVTLVPRDGRYSGNGWLQLAGVGTPEKYEASASFEGTNISSVVSFSGAPVSRLGDYPVSGNLSGSVAVTGDLFHPSVVGSISLPDGALYSDPISANMRIAYRTNELQVSQLNLQYLSNALTNGSGSYNAASGGFSFASDFRGEVTGDIVRARVTLGGTTKAGDLAANAQVGSLTIAGAAAPSWSVQVAKKGARTAFSGGPDGAVAGWILDTGVFYVSLADPLPLALQASGTLSGSEINASLQNVVLDLKAFDSVVKIPYFDISRGKARGNLTISGAINDPDFQGDLNATNVYGKTIVVPEEVGPFTADLAFRGKTLSMSDVTIPSGQSQVLGNLNFTMDHWGPSAFDITFQTRSRGGVHVKYTVSGIDFDGYATGNVHIQGDPLTTQVSGDLTVDSCVVTIGRTGETPPSSGPVEDNTNYFFTIKTGPRVEFLWPSQNLPILRSYADTAQIIKITSIGSTGDFSIVGNVNVKGGEVYYFRQSFYLQQGSISFNEDQNKVDPLLNARAEIREVDSAGRNVSIYLVVNNQPLSQFSPRFESDPAMSNADILALLGQNIYTQLGGQQVDLTSASLLGVDVLSQFGILRPFEQKVRDLFGLDLFSIRTDLLQNIIKEKLFGESITSPSTPGASTLGQYLDNTTFFLGKYFGNDLFLEAMINLRSNNTLLSEYGGNPGSLQVDSQVILEWKTPLFLLQLSVLPDPTNLVSSLLNTSVSLSWGFSF